MKENAIGRTRPKWPTTYNSLKESSSARACSCKAFLSRLPSPRFCSVLLFSFAFFRAVPECYQKNCVFYNANTHWGLQGLHLNARVNIVNVDTTCRIKTLTLHLIKKNRQGWTCKNFFPASPPSRGLDKRLSAFLGNSNVFTYLLYPSTMFLVSTNHV